jgi:hypothetical protein
LMVAGSSTAYLLAGRGRASQPGVVAAAQVEHAAVAVAPGRVKPASGEVKTSPAVRVKLETALVEEIGRYLPDQSRRLYR